VEGFVGRYERQLDPKGRVALPATFRNRLEPRCYLVLGQDKCISVVTVAVSLAWAEEMTEAVKRGEKTALNCERWPQIWLRSPLTAKGESPWTTICVSSLV